MKSVHRISLFVVQIICGASLSQAQVVPNAGFEDTVNHQALHWYAGDSTAPYRLNTDDAYEGSFSLEVSHIPFETSRYALSEQIYHDFTDSFYVCYAMLNCSMGVGSMRISFYNPDSTNNVHYFYNVNRTDGWQLKQIKVQPPSNAASFRFGFSHYWKDQQTLMLVDSVGLKVYRDLLAVEGPSVSELQVYPNPCTTSFSLNGRLPAPTSQINLMDHCGRLVKHFPATALNTYDISSLPPGIYFLELRQDSIIYRAKLVKE